MNCSNCGAEMDKGFIQSSRVIFWSNKERNLIFIPNESIGDTIIRLGGSAEESYICKKCSIVLLKYLSYHLQL